MAQIANRQSANRQPPNPWPFLLSKGRRRKKQMKLKATYIWQMATKWGR
jgi:hypothetical protein